MLVFIDALTRFAEIYAVSDMSAYRATRCLVDFVSRYPNVKFLLSDRGTQFESKELHQMCLKFGIKKLRTTAYRPQGNSICERFNGTIQTRIKALLHQYKQAATEWDRVLPHALKDYRTTVHSITGFTPCELVFYGSQRKMALAQHRSTVSGANRNKNAKTSSWQPKEGDKVLLKCPHPTRKGYLPQHKDDVVLKLKTPQTVELQHNGVVSVTRIAPLPKSYTVEANEFKNDFIRPSAAENAENHLIDDENVNIDYYNPNQPQIQDGPSAPQLSQPEAVPSSSTQPVLPQAVPTTPAQNLPNPRRSSRIRSSRIPVSSRGN